MSVTGSAHAWKTETNMQGKIRNVSGKGLIQISTFPLSATNSLMSTGIILVWIFIYLKITSVAITLVIHLMFVL